jgi:aminopeptidase 2
MDMIAIPDFGAGAMENWGLVTYREVLLLFDEMKTSAQSKKKIAYVIAHELAHQWFGNLVTMDWWNE